MDWKDPDAVKAYFRALNATPERKAYMKSYNAKYREEHREALAVKYAAYREAHREEARERTRAWNEANPERKQAYDNSPMGYLNGVIAKARRSSAAKSAQLEEMLNG